MIYLWGSKLWYFIHTVTYNYPVNPTKNDKNTPENNPTMPAQPACFIFAKSAPIAVATTEKSLNIEPPNNAIPANKGMSAIPFFEPNKAKTSPAKTARATPGIFFLKRCFET